MDSNKSKSGMAAIAVVVALVIGMGGGYAIGNHKKDDKNSSMNNGSAMTMEASSDGTTVGGAKMVRTKDVVDNAANAKNVTTLVAAVKAAGLVDTLKGEGPFTVFGPDNDAFSALPAGTVDTLLKPENKDQLVKILTYHVVAGTYTSADLKVMAEKGETLTTVQGEQLTPVINGDMVELKDAKGNMVEIETPDIISSNGVTHVIKSVLMPN